MITVYYYVKLTVPWVVGLCIIKTSALSSKYINNVCEEISTKHKTIIKCIKLDEYIVFLHFVASDVNVNGSKLYIGRNKVYMYRSFFIYSIQLVYNWEDRKNPNGLYIFPREVGHHYNSRGGVFEINNSDPKIGGIN